MHNQTIGFIGGGMMATALIEGLVKRQHVDARRIYVSEVSEARVSLLRESHGVIAGLGAAPFADKVDLLVLAVKPQSLPAALKEVAPLLPDSTLVLSIVAGVPLSYLERALPRNPIMRVMPNVALSVGAGMSAYTLNERAGQVDVSAALAMLTASGRAVQVDEALMDAVTGLSGSAPAYAFLVIDALSDGGVAAGLPRDTARLLAAQTLLGAARMVLDTRQHPDALRDMVTSPAGTTIAGVRVLEQRAVRSAFLDAVLAATERSAELGKA